MSIIWRLIIPLKITDISEFLFPKKIVDRFFLRSTSIFVSEPTSTCAFCSERNPKALKGVCVHVLAQSHPTLCNPIDCSLPGSSAHGSLQEKVVEWIAISTARESSRPRDWTCVSWVGRWILPLGLPGKPLKGAFSTKSMCLRVSECWCWQCWPQACHSCRASTGNSTVTVTIALQITSFWRRLCSWPSSTPMPSLTMQWRETWRCCWPSSAISLPCRMRTGTGKSGLL